MTDATNRYEPRKVSPPGGTLLDLLAERGMAQNELAERTGLTPKAINEIARGKCAITSDTALKLERALGLPAEFWLAREQHYQEWLARQRAGKEQAKAIAWLQRIPVRELVKAGAIRAFKDKAEQVGEVFRFFGVASASAWDEVYANPQAAFRRSKAFSCDSGAIAAWLRLGELQAQAIRSEPYRADRFRQVLRDAVPLTQLPFGEVADRLRDACASAGVALVFVPEVDGCRAAGVTRWLSPTKALVQLSDRYKTEDHLWFTFFHEAGHILLHKKKAVFLEGGGDGAPEEEEANRFAQESLLTSAAYAEIRGLGSREVTRSVVEAFAERHGVAPGIIVGRLQHDGVIPYHALRELRRPFRLPSHHAP